MILLPEDYYYSQRNNKLQKEVACNVTSYAMYGACMGWHKELEKKAKGVSLSLDDYFMSLLMTKEAKTFCKAMGSTAPPWETFRMFPEYLEPLLFGETRSCIDWNMNFDKVLSCLGDDLPVMQAGDYIYKTRRGMKVIGHYNCVIGKSGNTLRLADPEGDYLTYYKSKKGYDVFMSREQWEYHIHKQSNGNFYAMHPLEARC